MSEKYAFWVTLRPQSDRCRQGEAEVCILDFKNTCFLEVLEAQSDRYYARQSQATYTQFQNHMVRVSEGKSDCH